MYEDFFAERLSKLRTAKNVSAREMSLSIGQNRNYINQIENRKMFPAMQTFFYICEYLNITPKDFFDQEVAHPRQLTELIEELKRLDAKTLEHISGLVKELGGKR